jgi:hypothetical protein
MPSRSPPHPSTRLQTVEEFSQDSFAGPLSQDPAHEFLATSKEFNIPLSELGRYTQETQMDQPTGVPEQSSSGSDMSTRLPGHRISDSLPILGKVLVESTPSNSGSSQSQPSQQPAKVKSNINRSSDRQPNIVGNIRPVNREVDTSSQDSTEAGSTLSSSYERYLAGELDPVDKNATQNSNDCVATQPSTQPEASSENDGDQIVDGSGDQTSATTNSKHLWVAPVAPATSVATSAPARAFLRMIDPRKAWRVRDLNVVWGPRVSKDKGRDEMPETQASPEVMVDGIERAVVDVGAWSFHQVAGPSRIKGQASARDDTVPVSRLPLSDPEPTNASVSVRVKSANERLDSRPIKRALARERNPGVDSAFSVNEHEDSDDDVPLAVMRSKRAPAVKPPKTRADAKKAPRRRSAKVCNLLSFRKARAFILEGH